METCTITRREEHIRTPIDNLIFPTKRQPVSGELSRLHESEESKLRSAVIRHVNRYLLRRIVIRHNRQGRVHHVQRRLLGRIRRANKNIHRRKILCSHRLLEILEELRPRHLPHVVGLRRRPHEGEKQVGEQHGGVYEERRKGGGVEEGVDMAVEKRGDGE
nr:hypothetical protein PanWU01x14_267450 [Ipomoea trifida]